MLGWMACVLLSSQCATLDGQSCWPCDVRVYSVAHWSAHTTKDSSVSQTNSTIAKGKVCVYIYCLSEVMPDILAMLIYKCLEQPLVKLFNLGQALNNFIEEFCLLAFSTKINFTNIKRWQVVKLLLLLLLVDLLACVGMCWAGQCSQQAVCLIYLLLRRW